MNEIGEPAIFLATCDTTGVEVYKCVRRYIVRQDGNYPSFLKREV